MNNIDYRIDRVLATGYPEPETRAGHLTCDICGEYMYGGDDYYNFNGDIVCEEHATEYIMEHYKRTVPYDL